MAAAPEPRQLTPQLSDDLLSPRKAQGRASGVATWMRDLGIALAIAAFFIVFLYQPVKVEGTSMMPSLDDQERIFINKFVYRIEPIQRGDIVVFRYPRDPQKSFIKRVVGVAGDRIRIVEGRVVVIDRMLEED
jgi:signal peptidase I